MTTKIYHLLYYSWGFLPLIFFFSCSRQANSAKEIIEKAENIIEQQPDSALNALNSIPYPEDLSKSLYNKYNLLLIQAKDKCDEDITGDTIIFAIKEYYIHKKDDHNAALAAFYCARVLHEQKDTDNAFIAYSSAIEFAGKIQDYNLMGLTQGNLGILYFEHTLYEKAIAVSIKAAGLYEEAGNHKNEIYALSMVGSCYLLKNKTDSAFRYYDESLKLADQYKIAELQSSVRQDKGVAYHEIKHYEMAKKMFREALTFSPDSIERARTLMNLANVYICENQTDSAKQYLNQVLTISFHDPNLIRFSYLLLSQTEEADKHYLQALKYYKQYYDYTDEVFSLEKNNKLIEIQQKYDFEKLKNTKNILIIKQGRELLILSLILLGICILFIIFYRKSAHNKKRLLEAEYKMASLQKMAKDFPEEKQHLRSVILEYSNVLRKAASIKMYITKEERKNGEDLIKKINKIVYEQDTNWEKLFHVMNQYHDGFYDKIHEKYPQLKDVEFRVCCLSCETNFNDMEISIIIGKSVDMVRRLRSDIRKKIGMKAYSQDFYSFLLQELSGK